MDDKPRRGRPSKFHPELADQARVLCRLGATDDDLAEFFKVNRDTIVEWKRIHPAFSGALKDGKDDADNQVKRRLFERATGYSHPAVKIFMPAGAKEPVYAPYVEHYPPDTTAAIFWLKNRQKDEWRDVQQREHSGTIGLEHWVLDSLGLSPKLTQVPIEGESRLIEE